jgi:hypothetical protein
MTTKRLCLPCVSMHADINFYWRERARGPCVRLSAHWHTHTGSAHKHFIAQLGARNSLFRTRKFYSPALRRTRPAATCGVVTSRIFSMPRSRLIFMARAEVSEKSTFYWRAAEIIVPPHTTHTDCGEIEASAHIRAVKSKPAGCTKEKQWRKTAGDFPAERESGRSKR